MEITTGMVNLKQKNNRMDYYYNCVAL